MITPNEKQVDSLAGIAAYVRENGSQVELEKNLFTNEEGYLLLFAIGDDYMAIYTINPDGEVSFTIGDNPESYTMRFVR